MKTIAGIILALVVLATNSLGAGSDEAIEVRIITDEGRALPTYLVRQNKDVKKVYAEAIKGEHYHIEVINRLNRKVGLVIAVDGRNIISGAKSWLKRSERMYILEPYASGKFSGWRTGQNRVNRFYFTDPPDSYAKAFGDSSAMGVIAVAAYPERQRQVTSPPIGQWSPFVNSSKGESRGAAPAPQAADRSNKARSGGQAEKVLESAGTGYGRGEYSPVRTVAFEPERHAVQAVYIKYEWHATLCSLGVINCRAPSLQPPNRMWGENSYAPAPPGR